MEVKVKISPLFLDNPNNLFCFKQFNEYRDTHGELFIYLKTSPKISEVEHIEENPITTDRIIEQIVRKYFLQEKGGIEPLRLSFNTVVEELQNLNIEGVAVLFYKEALYFLVKANLEIRLIRQKSEAILLRGKEENMVSISGFPKDEDIIMVSTLNFFQIINPGKYLKEESLDFSQIIPEIESVAIEEGVTDSTLIISCNGSAPLMQESPVIQDTETVEREVKKNILSNIFISGLSKLRVKKEPTGQIEEERNRKPLIVGAIFLLLLITSIIFGLIKNKTTRERKDMEDRLAVAKNYLNEAKNFKESDKTKARENYIKSKQELESLKSQKGENSTLIEFEKELSSYAADLLGEKNADTSLYLDTSLISDNFIPSTLASDTKDIVFFDKENKKVIKHTFQNKKTLGIAGPDQLDGVSQITFYQSVLYSLKSDGIYEVATNKKLVEKDWVENVFFSSYGGNLYLLDKDSNKIYRFSATSNGFSGRQDWLAPGIEPTFSGVKNILVDGSVYIGLDSKIVKYNRGAPAGFTLDDVTPQLSKITHFYTHELLKNIYILDSSNSRVLVFDKNGKYVMQYSNDSFKDATLVFASEAKNEIYVSIEAKIFSFQI